VDAVAAPVAAVADEWELVAAMNAEEASAALAAQVCLWRAFLYP
jgi:hypothetical protein